jgi:hypothetical protein
VKRREKATESAGVSEAEELEAWIAEAALERWEHLDRAERKRKRDRPDD